MRRPLFPLLILSLLAVAALWLCALAPAWAEGGHGAAPAEDHAAPAAAPAMPAASAEHADPATSPWEHPLWHNATAMMRIYVCEYARRPPTWCGAPRELPASVPLPEPQGPPLIEEDARWLDFIEHADPAALTAEEVAAVRRRAIERRDPQAMEILGYLYAEGQSVARDYKEAYRWYGMAFLAGEKRVRPNMDIVWQQLQRHDLEGALELTREFDALSAGEVPASLRLPPPGPSAEAPAESPAEPRAAAGGSDSAAAIR